MASRTRRRGYAVTAGAALSVLALAACGGGSSTGASGTPSAANTDPACAQFASYGSFSGKTVNVYTSILPPEDKLFKDAWKQFETCTGITVKYEGSNDFESSLKVRVDGG